MAVEMAASRLLAPYFGTSLFVWTCLIGIIMVALTVGYRVGGKMADRNPVPQGLFRWVLIGGLLVSAIPFLSHSILGLTLGATNVGVLGGAFLGVALLFAVPVGLLGVVSPYAIRLVSDSPETAGQAAGSIYALSTAGSILGTFLPGFVMIPMLGTKATILTCGVALSLLGALGLKMRKTALALAFAGIGLNAFTQPLKEIPGLVESAESPYNFIQVVQSEAKGKKKPRTALVLNEGRAIHSIHDPSGMYAPFVGSVWDYMAVLPVLAQPESGPMKTGVVGLAAGTVPHQWIELYGSRLDLKVLGAEIDPKILEMGRKYFSMAEDEASGRLEAFAEDGRRFLARQPPKSFDVLLTDAYKQPYIPFHLASREYFQLVRSRLKDTGVMAINVGAIDVKSEIFIRLLSTVRDVFDPVHYILVKNRNVPFNNHVVVASPTEIDFERLDLRQNPLLQEIFRETTNSYIPHLFRTADKNLYRFNDYDPERVFTDDRAPVEFYTEKMVLDFLSGGGAIPGG